MPQVFSFRFGKISYYEEMWFGLCSFVLRLTTISYTVSGPKKETGNALQILL